jgi:S-adenosylmethionine hydrolase
VQEITALPPFRAVPVDDDSLAGTIIHIDRFGNAITTIRGEQLSVPEVRIDIAGRRIQGLCRSYADRGGLVALIGSSGFLEVAVNGGSASDSLDLQIGDIVFARVV